MDDYDMAIPCQHLEEALEHLLNTSFKISVVPRVTMPEVLQAFRAQFVQKDGHWIIYNEKSFLNFLKSMYHLSMDRLLAQMVDLGHIDLLHDGEEFCFRRSTPTTQTNASKEL